MEERNCPMRKGLQIAQSFRRQDLSTTPYPSSRRHLIFSGSTWSTFAGLILLVDTDAGKSCDGTRALQNTAVFLNICCTD